MQFGDIVCVFGGFPQTGRVALKAGTSGEVSAANVLWRDNSSTYVPTPVLHDGRLIAQGTHDELLRSSDLYRRMCARLSVGKSLDDPETVDELMRA